MPDLRQAAIADFKRIMKWIGAVAVLMVVGALTYLKLFSTLDTMTVIAVTFGVFFSVLLGCGLFAATFFSDKSGLDQNVTDATRSERALRRVTNNHSNTRRNIR
jgi:protein-S-isoprenylcysteine O-methyltransferase Ste14